MDWNGACIQSCRSVICIIDGAVSHGIDIQIIINVIPQPWRRGRSSNFRGAGFAI